MNDAVNSQPMKLRTSGVAVLFFLVGSFSEAQNFHKTDCGIKFGG